MPPTFRLRQQTVLYHIFPQIARGFLKIYKNFNFLFKKRGGAARRQQHSVRSLDVLIVLILVILAMIILVSVLTDYIVCGTVTTVVTTPLYLAYSSRSVLLGLILTVAAAVILIKHRENYQRIRSRTEIGVKSALRGDHRIRQK